MYKAHIIRVGIWGGMALAIFYPLWVRYNSVSGGSGDVISVLFPFFGLLAFTLLWLHIMSGVFEPFLRRYIPFDEWIHYSSLVIFVCIITHPLLALATFDFNVQLLLFSYEKSYIILGLFALLLLLTYDIGKILQRYHYFERHWNTILFISTLGIIVSFIHSIGVGSDLQNGPLRTVWFFYGLSAIAGTVYNFGTSVLHRYTNR